MTPTTFDVAATNLYNFGKTVEDAFCGYHGHLVKTFSDFETNDVLIELALKVAGVVAAPLLYPILGAAYLTSKLLLDDPIGISDKLGVSKISVAPRALTLSEQIDILRKSGLPGWEKKAMRLIRKARHDSPSNELKRLRTCGVLTDSIDQRLNEAIGKVAATTSWQRDQIKVIMGQALEVKSIFAATHHVFIHAQASYWVGLNYLIKELTRAYEPERNIKHFKFLRPPCKLAQLEAWSSRWKTVRSMFNPFIGEERIETVKDYINSKWYVSDNDGETREHLLSVDAYFFNHQRYESSLFFLMNNANIFGKTDTVKQFYKQIITHFRPDLSDYKLSQLANRVFNASNGQATVCGNLFAICVPKEKSLDIQYRAHPFGLVCNCHSDDKAIEVITELQKDILGVNSKCAITSHCPIPQFRLYTPLLKPETTPVYLLTPQNRDFRRQMKAKIQGIAQEIRG